MIRIILSLLLSSIMMCGAAFAQEQDYPTKPIRFINPNSPGLTGDIVTRKLAEEMSKVLKQPIVVENKEGAGQMIGLEYVATQMPADGYTAIFVFEGAMAALPVTMKSLRFDVQKDLVPIIGVMEGTTMLLSSTQSPWKTFDEMVKYSRANPGKVNFAMQSSQWRMVAESVFGSAPGLGLDILYVPYKGGGPAFLAVMSGECQLLIASVSSIEQSGGKMRGIAVTGETRLPSHPDIPTFKELGFPHFPSLRFTLSVRAGTPESVKKKLFAAATQALQQPEMKAVISRGGMEVSPYTTPEAAVKAFTGELALYADMAKKLGVEPQ